MAQQSWKASLWFTERTPDIFFWFIMVISLVVLSSGFRVFHKMRTNKEGLEYKFTTLNKWLIFGLSMLLLAMLIGLSIYRIEAFYGILPFYTTYVWKLYLFIGFTMMVMLGLWIYKGIVTKMFIEWKDDATKWYNKIKSKEKEVENKVIPSLSISSPVSGKLKKLANVKDDVFSQKLMGDGIAIVPSTGNVYAPVDGTMETVFNTKHAYGIRTEEGIAILIHIGIDTVNLKGEGFKSLVKQGEKVNKGQLIAKVDLKKLKAKKVITDIIVLVLPESETAIELPKLTGTVTSKSTIIKTVEKVLVPTNA